MPAPRPDASMSLLHDLKQTSLDPGYAQAHAKGTPPHSARSLVVVVLLLAGLMFGIATAADSRDRPQAAKDREALITQVKNQQKTNDALRDQLNERQDAVEKLRVAALGSTASPAGRDLTELGSQVGVAAVTGPGVVIVVDDSERLSGEQAHVIDQDLRMLVNGLWQAGAEAIAINGHRLSARTAIRGAGNAITVDYTSLTRPYRVEAIGDRRTLPANLATTQGGQWWEYLKQNYGMRYSISPVDKVRLGPDPGLGLTRAGRVK